MKKNYEAPTFNVITYSLQEAIAANCTVPKYINSGSASSCDEDSRFESFNFGKDEECSIWIEGYCYFTSTSNIVSTS